MTTENELTFCSDAAGWMNQELDACPELAFSRVKIEQSPKGSRKRRDLTIYDRSDMIAVTGEVKLPYMAAGGSPYNESVVDDAFNKAAKVGARFFVTWNVNRLVLWQTDDAGKPLHERHIYDDAFTQVRDEDDLVNPVVQQTIRRGLIRFLERASQAYTGALPLAKRPLDEFFITVLEAALERPIAAVMRAITKKYVRGATFKTRLNSWMRDAQGWQLSDDELIQRDNLERAAKFSCYVLVNKVVFYKALRKRFTRLPNIRIPAKITSAADAEHMLNGFFQKAIKATRDYETVFTDDFADTLPFLTDDAVPAWRDLLQSIDKFDFTQINYDVIGPIFERLISPEERHRYGQHYTKAEIVDLIEAFCIRTPETTVLDPSCGGGTFLVRAYNRKKFLAEAAGTELSHERLLDQLYGIDVSAYAAHLTTMNLATRDLIDEQNYPLIARDDFFNAEPGRALFQIPIARGAEAKQLRPVLMDRVDAVVGNPPYVRQEEINKPPTTSAKGRVKIKPRSLDQIKAEARKYKNRLSSLVQQACPDIRFSGRSDLHLYFWAHGLRFLKDGGYFGFLTSSGWLDVEYGFRLQEFLLKHYAILAVFESEVEPWFTGARITTCATILRRESDASKRERNLVRFVRLRSPLGEIFPPDATEEQRQRAAEALRDRIEGITNDTSERHWRVRVVRQGELYRLGCRVNGRSADAQYDDSGVIDSNVSGMSTEGRRYFGSKWGVYLRAPDFFFELQHRFGARMVPLGEIADVRFGVKTGSDRFFFVRDITDRCLAEVAKPREFRAKYGIQRVQADKIRIVLAGDKSVHLIEAEYLEPEVHSLMEITRCTIDKGQLERCVFLCSESKQKLTKTRALKYIRWGEKESFHKIVTVAARARNRPWYDITDCIRPQLILPKIQQYRHIVPLNPAAWTCNCSLLGITTTLDPEVLCGLLNSTLVGLIKWFYGRQLGNEANLQLDVYAANILPVPDPRGVPTSALRRVKTAIRRLAKRDTGDLDEELQSPDRYELDDAVFEILGEHSTERRKDWVARLHIELEAFHRAMKEKEILAMRNRAITARRSKLSPAQMAEDARNNLHPSHVQELPEDFFGNPKPVPVEEIELPEGDKCKLLSSPLTGEAGIDIDGTHIELGDERRAELAKAVFDIGRRGTVPIPIDPELCAQVLTRYHAYMDRMTAEFHRVAALKTSDEKTQAKVVEILKRKLINDMASPPRPRSDNLQPP